METETLYAVCIMNPDGGSGVNGLVKITHPKGGKSKINVRITGLAEGQHGFHIHQFGNLTEECKTAGPHFNPNKRLHGGPTDEEGSRHVGDLGNVTAGADGVAEHEFEDSLVELWGENTVFGRSFVVHAGVDDLGKGGHELSSTTGNAGGRLACGVIGISNTL